MDDLKFDPDNLQLDAEEQEIVDAYERGEFVPDEHSEAQMAALRAAATVTLNKEQRINIRVTLRDLVALKARAEKEGLPYQTLAASILHKFVDGRLIEIGEYERAVQLASAVAEGRGAYRVKGEAAGAGDAPASGGAGAE